MRLLVVLAVPVFGLPAQTLAELRQLVRESAVASRYASMLPVLADLAEEGFLSGGRLTVDTQPETEIAHMTLPLSADVPLDGDGTLFHLEVMLGYASARAHFDDVWGGTQPGLETSIDTRYEAVAGETGAGFAMPVADGWLAQALVHGGIARVDNQTIYTGAGAAITQALTQGILFDWNATYGSWGGSFAFRQPRFDWAGLQLDALVRYDLRRSDGLEVDDPAQDTDDTTQWVTVRIGSQRPLAWTIADRPLRWLADVGYWRMLGDTRDVLGFHDYFEFGTGLGWDCGDTLPLISDLRLGAAVMVGEDVFGWSVGLATTF